MYPLSSQRRSWTFANEEQLRIFRVEQNTKYIEEHETEAPTTGNLADFFLTPDEERLLLKQYEIYLVDFCRRFEPPMPKCVIGTAFHYFKRFYLNNTPMDYHPKEILATCVFVACKVEEFNVSINQFVNNIKGDRNKATDIVLSNELLLIGQLNYYLTIHNPFRPIEGFLIDIKTRSKMINPDRLRPHIDSFIDSIFFTDACMLHTPSQIGLASILHAASKEQENLDSYVTDLLFVSAPEKLRSIIEAVRKIRMLVKNYEPPDREAVKAIEKKLDKCRNQNNNPDSELYKERLRRLYTDEDDMPAEDASFHIADVSSDTSAMNISQ
ncbi:hypothetical protein KR044_003653 [Drosophila immigrans]|nr:hypothetical protein KR044_003653 [Drosophila immigrans]